MKTAPHWRRIGLTPHHGICVPLFSLHSQTSFGTGEFLDLIPLIDWAKQVGLDVIQLLPIYDTGTDPSPYNPVSSCALDPIYLSLSELNIPLSNPPSGKENILSIKLKHLNTLFEQTFSTLSETPAYQDFLAQNPWLPSYCQFKALNESPFSAPFYTFIQFHAFRQMKKVKEHAGKQRIYLKGDLPILPSPQSADVWENPALFHLDLSAGAPPDLYNSQGQSWGFPLFNWEAIKKDNYQWWKRRLKVVDQLFDIYRIDHVVGLFRIWGIKRGGKAFEGSFFPSDPSLWTAHGREILEMMIDSATALPMAEDLGTIPSEVYSTLKELGICGTKVVRWQRTNSSYIPFNQYEPLSMTTLSTADMEPLELWWERFPAESVSFASFMGWNYHPLLTSNQRLQILRQAHHSSSLFHINLLQEYLALFPDLVSPNPEKERVNIPGTLLPTNWTYRFRPSVEELLSHKSLASLFELILN